MTSPTYSDDNAYVRHQGLLAERPMALCYRVDGRVVWFPKMHVRDRNDQYVVIPKWMADSKKALSDF
jgi:hypothetical protein